MTNMPTLELEHMAIDQWLWRFKAGNGKKISWSGESYVDSTGCIDGANIGSPCHEVDVAFATGADTVPCYYNGELVDAHFKIIDNYSPTQTTPTDRLTATPEAREIVGDLILNDKGLTFLIEAGIKYMGGHIAMNDEIWHVKYPGADHCRIGGCNMGMVEQ